MHHTIQKKKKAVWPKSGARADPKSGSGLRFFFQKTSVFGLVNQWPQEGMPLVVLVLSSPPLF